MMNRKELYINNFNRMRMNDFDLYDSVGYFDPDGFPSNKSGDVYNYKFYETLCFALQNNLNNLKKNSKYKEKLESIMFVCDPLHNKKSNKGIFIYENEKKIFQLKSDQFGFTAHYGDNHYIYPYRVFLNNLSNSISEKELNFQTKLIFGDEGWINKTRLVGGSFLWPIDFETDGKDRYGNNTYNPKYNSVRGGHCGSNKSYYIQDRVDLTLFEIKEVYKEIIVPKNVKTVKGNKLSRCLYSNNKKTKLYKFLELFGDFETLIKVFGFDDNFVIWDNNKKEWKIINIACTRFKDVINKKTDSYIYLEDDDNMYVLEAREGNKLLTKDTKSKDLAEIFDVLCELIKQRRNRLKIRD